MVMDNKISFEKLTHMLHICTIYVIQYKND